MDREDWEENEYDDEIDEDYDPEEEMDEDDEDMQMDMEDELERAADDDPNEIVVSLDELLSAYLQAYCRPCRDFPEAHRGFQIVQATQ